MFQYLRFLIAAFVRVLSLSRGGRIVAAQTHNVPNLLVFASLPAKLRGARVLLDLQEPMPELYADRFGIDRSGILWRLLLVEERFSCSYADQLTTVSETVRDVLRRRIPHRSPIVVLPNTPDETLFFPAATSRGDESEDFLISCHSSLLPRYGLDTLIKSVSHLDHLPRVRLEIFGEGEDRDRLVDLVAVLGVEERVTFRGRYPLGELADLLRRAKVGIVPLARTPFTEIMAPNKLFEYVALGTPVIASRLAGMEQYFDDSEVLFVDAGSDAALAAAIETLYNNPSLRSHLAANALKRFEHYRWSSFVDTYVSIVRGEPLASEATGVDAD